MKGYTSCTKFLSNYVTCSFFDEDDHLFRKGQANAQILMLIAGSVWLSQNEAVYEYEEEADSMDFMSSGESSRVIVRQQSATLLAVPSPSATASKIVKGSTKIVGGSTKIVMDHIHKTAREDLTKATVTQWACAAGAEKQCRSEHSERANSNILTRAAMQLRHDDLRLRIAARRVQRHWRSRIRKVKSVTRTTQGMHQGSEQETRRPAPGFALHASNEVSAPCYFGESCLWQPVEQWDFPGPPYLYSAKCRSRSEVLTIPRKGVHKMLESFHPWLEARFEIFRQAVITSFKDVAADAAAASYSWNSRQNDAEHESQSHRTL
jgi:hypothetical protein